MRLRRGTTAAFLSLQNYVFRGPPPYLSKHNKFPLCLPFLLRRRSSSFHRLFFRRLPFSGSATGTRVCPSSMPEPYICSSVTRSLSTSRHRRIRSSLSIRESNIHTHTSVRVFPRIHPFPRPSFSSDELIQIGANYRNRVSATSQRGIIPRQGMRTTHDAYFFAL